MSFRIILIEMQKISSEERAPEKQDVVWKEAFNFYFF